MERDILYEGLTPMDDDHRTLSLKEAYRFGEEHGLGREIAEIRDMEIEWDLSYTSSLRRGFVVDLFTRRGVMELFNQEHWPAGGTHWGRGRAQFWLRLKARYEAFVEGGIDTDEALEETEEEQAFAAEADLRDFLANNLGCVENGLRLFSRDEQKGVEFPIEDGRIDILAIDKSNTFVVFELKLSRGRSKALGQLLYYMAWVDSHLGNGPCRGIIVAKDISSDLVLASCRVQGVSPFRYKLSVSLEPVEKQLCAS